MSLQRGLGGIPYPIREQPKIENEDGSVNRNQIVNELSKSLHGKLAEYQPIIGEACRVDPEFLSHLIAWDFTNGQIKDTKIALPVLTIANREFPDELVENSLAHLALQPARELLKALRFSIEVGTVARRQKRLERVIRGYLAQKEKVPEKWSRSVARQRRAWKELYNLTHCPMPVWASITLHGFYKSPETGEKIKGSFVPGSIFSDIANLAKMPANLAAATIQKWHLSPLVVSGAMAGAKAKLEDSAVVQAGIAQMTGNEALNRVKRLAQKDVKSALRNKISQVAERSAKTATLKAGVAAEEVEDESLKTMLKELQERQIEQQKASGKGIDGNWLVISDRSGSQEHSMDLGKMVAATIAKFVYGKVFLVFCNTDADKRDVTGKTLEQIKEETKFVRAAGGTSYGVGLYWPSAWAWDGIVVVGDGAENSPPLFHQAYKSYQGTGRTPPVYLFKTASTESAMSCMAFERSMISIGHPVKVFDMTHGKVDYYSLPNLVQTMNADHFGVVDKIMACPLVTLEQVLPGFVERKEVKVHA